MYQEHVSIEDYITLKTKLLANYNLLLDFNEEHRNRFLNSMGKLKTIAINTYLFPYDLDLFYDMKSVSQESLMTSGLQEKYHISDQILFSKYQEYHGFQFGELLSNGKLDFNLFNQFHYPKTSQQSTIVTNNK